MRILTLNINSHSRNFNKKEYENTINEVVDYIEKQKIDIFTIQECSQTHNEALVNEKYLQNYIAADNLVPIKKDNCAFLINKKLAEKGLNYDWTWTGMKYGYDIYDEGLAVFLKGKINEADSFYFSKTHDYNNWKARKALKINGSCCNNNYIIYNLHMGWWDDNEESFKDQFEFLQSKIEKKCHNVDNVFLCGDFNSPSNEKNKGYDLVKKYGWYDTYELANEKDDGFSVLEKIDGWRDNEIKGMRIDYIWSLKKILVNKSQIVFNGTNRRRISDHCGVIIES
ncbi:endonuclease/exonuclease/phosphatase family protein [Lachnobacterium bovis]|uniref:Maltose 6'-phosphate phosphatase n=1 Tax=Lachnobacterium bovis TaxID=140626 RepID=A0A1H9PXF7_9FIRM|nr:endonuclease/exonuclease/phosphatase family protein [Lachnobacterium bovis]SER52830.1 maltose 6'-phosphate phosphatase [Lachnobacterium bovis]